MRPGGKRIVPRGESDLSAFGADVSKENKQIGWETKRSLE